MGCGGERAEVVRPVAGSCEEEVWAQLGVTWVWFEVPPLRIFIENSLIL